MIMNQPAAWKSPKSSSAISSELWFFFSFESGCGCSFLESSLSSKFALKVEFGDLGLLGEVVGEKVDGGGGGGLIESKGSLLGSLVSVIERLFTPCSMDFGFILPPGFWQLMCSIEKMSMGLSSKQFDRWRKKE